MLVLSRKLMEAIKIGEDVTITVVRIQGDKVRLAIDAPKDVRVDRSEIYELKKQQEKPGPA